MVGADVNGKVQSIDELVNVVIDARKSGKGMRGDVVYVSGMPLEFWSKTDELNARFSAGDFASVPVYLGGSDGHTGWGNRVLLRRAGITKHFFAHLSADEHAYYGIGKDGEPNGFVVDAGREKLDAAAPPPSKEQYLEGGRAAIKYLHSLGITAWLDALVNDTVLSTYKSLAEQSDLSPHVAAFWKVEPRNDPAKELEIVRKMRQQYAGIPNLTVPGIKVFADGVVEYPSRTATLTKPYKNTGRSGDLLFEPARFAELATAADKQGRIVQATNFPLTPS